MCNEGLFGHGFDCVDSNECGDLNITEHLNLTDSYYYTHTCHDDATCINVYDGYNCTCNEGYDGDGFNCTDIDECVDETHLCHADATCTNTIGSYECACDDGVFGDGFDCVDSNECGDLNITDHMNVTDPLWDTHNCAADAVCENTYMSFNCTCQDGYFGDGIECTDSDECEDAVTAVVTAGVTDPVWGMHECDVNAACVSLIGSYNCTCDDGFEGDGFNCTDVDECSDETHACHVDAACNNTIGAYECMCDEGLFGDGFNCTDSDECGDIAITTFGGVTDPGHATHSCHADAFCINTYAEYNCTCSDGYVGDGFNCTDVDECADKTHTCHMDACATIHRCLRVIV